MNLFIGDSHILALERFQNSSNVLYQFSAASIRGLTNINSVTGARTEIMKIIKAKPFTRLFIMFGKVDMEWIYPYKNAKKDLKDWTNIGEFIDETVSNYIKFIDEISHYFKEVYVMGLHLPSLQSQAMLYCINSYNAVKDVTGKGGMDQSPVSIKNLHSLEERTQQIIRFNETLRDKIRNKYLYIEITDVLLDTQTLKCKDYYVIPGDHHLHRIKTGTSWQEKHLASLL